MIRRLMTIAGLACCAAGLAAAQACGTFSSDADAPGTDASAENVPLGDAAMDSALLPDAADAAEAGPPLTGCRARYASGDAGIDGGELLFCDDFEGTSDAGGRWNGAPTQFGTLSLMPSDAGSGMSLRMTIDSPPAGNPVDKFAMVRLELAAGLLPLKVEYDLLVETVAPVGDPIDPSAGFFMAELAAVKVTAGIAEGGTFNPFLAGNGIPPLFQPTNARHHVIISVTQGGVRLEMATAGRPDVNKAFGKSVPQTEPLALWLGAYSGTSGGPVVLYIDDVFIHR